MAPGFLGSSRFRQSWGWLRAQSTARSEKGHFRRPLNWGPIGRRDGSRRKFMIGSTIKFDVAEEYRREFYSPAELRQMTSDVARAPSGLGRCYRQREQLMSKRLIK